MWYNYRRNILNMRYRPWMPALGLIFSLALIIMLAGFQGRSEVTKDSPGKSEVKDGHQMAIVKRSVHLSETVNTSRQGDVLRPESYTTSGRTLASSTSRRSKLTRKDRAAIRRYLREYTIKCEEYWIRNKTVGDSLSYALRNRTFMCDCVPDTLIGRVKPENLDQVNYRLLTVEIGGHWRPRDCMARQRIAVIIPYMNREEHLPVLLNTLHPLLQRQQLDYRIFVIEQVHPEIFNKGAIMNAGFIEATRKFGKFDCYIFHDVDMIPEDDRNFYTCVAGSPLRLSVLISKFNYSLGKSKGVTVGGVVGFSPQNFELVNGYSNRFFGWGGEDDDMFYRILYAKLKISSHSKSVARYTMIKHGKDESFPQNPDRFYKLEDVYYYGIDAAIVDGFTTTEYETLNIRLERLYTHIQIAILSRNKL